ncbi:hypothetical protein AAD001_11535 [Colwelliaceae bacterium 6471]
MSSFMLNVTRYRHYLIVLAALVIANYVIVPLSEWQDEQKQLLSLIAKKHDKVSELINNEAVLSNKANIAKNNMEKMLAYIFTDEDEAKFKLTAQSAVESILTKAGCTIERIGFKGSTEVAPNVERWSLELRYKGDEICVLDTSRGLESTQPVIRVDEYNINHRGLKKEAMGSFNITSEVSVWYINEKPGATS